MPAFERAFPELHVQAAGGTGCTPTIDVEGDWYCPRIIRHVLDEHIPQADIGTVILSARWSEGDIAPLRDTAAYLSRFADQIVILGPTPEYLDSFPRILARNLRYGTEGLERFLDEEVRALDRRMRGVDWGDGVQYVSMHDLICPGGCRLFTESGVPYLADYGHYTRAAADEIALDLKELGIVHPR